VLSRPTVLPVLILAAWSRVWLGWWVLVPGAIAPLWTWLNPRLFGRPVSLDKWASKAMLGERVWINRDEEPVPGHHQWVPNILNVVSGIDTVFVVWGVVQVAVWPTLFGAALTRFRAADIDIPFPQRVVHLREPPSADAPAAGPAATSAADSQTNDRSATTTSP
jgi:hypothetical protein